MKITRKQLKRIIKEEYKGITEVNNAYLTPEKDRAFDLISASGSFTPAQVLDLLYYIIQDIKSVDMTDENAYKKISNHIMNSTGTMLEPETHSLDTDRDGNIDYSEVEAVGDTFDLTLAR